MLDVNGSSSWQFIVLCIRALLWKKGMQSCLQGGLSCFSRSSEAVKDFRRFAKEPDTAVAVAAIRALAGVIARLISKSFFWLVLFYRSL